MRTQSIERSLLVLYLTGSVLYYLATWYVYGGFMDDGHPPIYSIGEFYSASGLKFTVFLLVTLVGLGLGKYVDRWPEWLRFGGGLLLFVLLTGLLEAKLLALNGWVNVFGGRSVVFSYLTAAAFFAIQWYVIPSRRDKALPAPENKGVQIDVTKGNSRYRIHSTAVRYAEAFGNYTKLVTDAETFLYGGGIGSFCDDHTEAGFLRIHRSYAINEAYLRHLRRTGRHPEIELDDGTVLRVGKAYVDRLAARSSLLA